MARDLSQLITLNTAEEVIACLLEAPNDRVLTVGSDLGPDDWDGSMATRADDYVLVIRSLKAMGASSICDFVQKRRKEGCPEGVHGGEIAVVGNSLVRDRFGWAVPSDVKQLLAEAEERTPGRLLQWTGYEGLCVLVDHPEAEKS